VTSKARLGEANGQSKLTAAKVREILASHAPRYVLAARFGVSYGAIRDVKTGISWYHVHRKCYLEDCNE
jgi:hypothetical protein